MGRSDVVEELLALWHIATVVEQAEFLSAVHPVDLEMLLASVQGRPAADRFSAPPTPFPGLGGGDN